MSGELPEDFPGAIVVALHRGKGSSSRLLDVLNRVSRLRVVEACIGGVLEPSTVVLSPVGAHVLIGSRGRIHLEATTAKLVCPSADRLLASMAASRCAEHIAVILSGRGADATLGSRLFGDVGATVIAQDEESALFPEMPRAAREIGHVDFVVPLEHMAFALAELVAPPEVDGADSGAVSVRRGR